MPKKVTASPAEVETGRARQRTGRNILLEDIFATDAGDLGITAIEEQIVEIALFSYYIDV